MILIGKQFEYFCIGNLNAIKSILLDLKDYL